MVSVSMPIRHIPAGLDARAASIVMKAIKNVALSNRTVFVTIHQPSIQIFEAFDFLMLLQVGPAGLLAGAGGWGRGSAGMPRSHACAVGRSPSRLPLALAAAWWARDLLWPPGHQQQQPGVLPGVSAG